MMTTNSTGNRCTSVTVNMNLGSVINVAKLFEGAYNQN